MRDSLLIELLTEELPPKSLRTLSEAFARSLFDKLNAQSFLDAESSYRLFATPRRLAALISKVAARQPDQTITRKGPALAAGFDAKGKPTAALAGFARSCGVAVDSLTNDGRFFFSTANREGETLEKLLPRLLDETLSGLPASKVMRWGVLDEQFVRPVHGLLMLHGSHVIPAELLGVKSGNSTLGHRFLSKGRISVEHAEDYELALKNRGKVIVDFANRRAHIEHGLQAAARDAMLALDDGLLDEITALTEYPIVYEGRFDEAFLAVPQECLMLAMKQHQRYVPLLSERRLLPRFLIVANIETADPRNIANGNERVLRARLSDAKFFFDQDAKIALAARVPALAKVVYQNKLGTQFDRVTRITALSAKIAQRLGADESAASRAAHLSKADLTSGMVGEFPELQGVMARYYALNDGEPELVADAIEQHYRPRFAGEQLPESRVAISVALADKLEALAGMFGIGQQPSGDKDPFALRRHALGVVRIIIERNVEVALDELVASAFSVFPGGMIADAHTDVRLFILERLRSYLRDAGYSANEVEAVLSLSPTRIDLVPKQLAAVRAFASLPEAESLAAANKRVVNILKQAQAKGESFTGTEPHALREPKERELFTALDKTAKTAGALFAKGDFEGYLKSFAVLKTPVDAFFDSVMVMTEDTTLRRNRLALLADLRREMNRVADISKLAA